VQAGADAGLVVRVAAQAVGAEAQQVDDVAARAERVRDRGSGVDGQRGPELVAHLGEEHVAGGREGAVEDGESADGGCVGGSSTADGEVHSRVPFLKSFRHLSKNHRQFRP